MFVDVASVPQTAMSPVLKLKDGEWTYADEAFLVPHEALRFMTERTSRVLEFYNPEICPWKVERMKTWFKDYFAPILHDHHDNEEKIFFPYYKKLGAKDFEKQSSDHETLVTALNDVIKALDAPNGNEVRAKYKLFADILIEHLNEEETFWPPVIEKYGSESLDKITKEVVSEGQKHGGQAFQMFLIEVCAAMGCNLNGAHPPEGWGTPKVKDKMQSELPGFVRFLLVPGWARTRQYYIDTLLSTAEDKETVVSGGWQCAVM